MDEQSLDSKQERKQESSLISRRKMIASLGMAGATLALGGVFSKVYADPIESRKKVKDLMSDNLVVYTTIADLRALSNQSIEALYYVTDAQQEGMFRFNPANTASADNGGTTIVSASGARFERIFDGAVNVKWFGAKGDGLHDDAAAIQKAIDAKQGVVFLPRGTYRTTVPIAITTGDSLVGEGPEVTIIEKSTTTPAAYGTRTFNGGSDNYNVDAVIIALPMPNDYVRYVHIEGIMARRGASESELPKNSSYGFYAPRVYFMTQKNVEYRYADTGYYTVDAWMVTLERVSSRWMMRGFVCGDRDAHAGGGTSHTVTSCWAGACEKSAWKIDVSYSSFIGCGADWIGYNSENPADYIYFLRGAALSLISCSAEDARGTLLHVYSAHATVMGLCTSRYYKNYTDDYAIKVLGQGTMLNLVGAEFIIDDSQPGGNMKAFKIDNGAKLWLSGTATLPDFKGESQIDRIGNGQYFVDEFKRGTSTQSASESTYTIPHGLGASPSCYNVIPASADAAGIQYVEANATNLVIHYASAPPTGTNNLKWTWEAKY